MGPWRLFLDCRGWSTGRCARTATGALTPRGRRVDLRRGDAGAGAARGGVAGAGDRHVADGTAVAAANGDHLRAARGRALLLRDAAAADEMAEVRSIG